MPLPTKPRRRADDAVDNERRLLPPLTAASRPPPLSRALWSVQEPELARSSSHLRFIARQQQSSKAKPRQPPYATPTGSVAQLSPRAVLVPIKPTNVLNTATRINAHSNNDAELVPVLQEIWRVATAAAKQQTHKEMKADTGSSGSCHKEAFVRPRDPVSNQETETVDNNGTTKARYRRLVGAVARKALLRIVHKAAENVARIRLETRCALSIQRLVRRFLGRRRRERLRFKLMDAVEKIEGQWQRTKARREARARRRELLAREQERKQAEEERLTAAREIQMRYKVFVEAKQQKRKEEETQQRRAFEERRRNATNVIGRMIRKVRQRAQARIQDTSEAAAMPERPSQSVELVTTSSETDRLVQVSASPPMAEAHSRTVTEGGVMGRCVAEESAMIRPRYQADSGFAGATLTTERDVSMAVQCSNEEHRHLENMDEPVLTTDGLVRPSVSSKHEAFQHDASWSASCTPLASQSTDDEDRVAQQTCSVYQPDESTTSHVSKAQPSGDGQLPWVESGSHHPAHDDVVVELTVSAPERRKAATVICNFLRTHCLAYARGQLHARHCAANRLQRLVRQRLARRRVAFQRRLHVVSLRSELQNHWLKSEALLTVGILAEDLTAATAAPIETPAQDDDDEDFSDDDGVRSAGGLSWAEVLPTRNGVIPSGLRLDFFTSHGPASSAAPPVGLWKWSWTAQRWQANRDLFTIAKITLKA